MKIRNCVVADLGTAIGIDIPCKQASDNTITTFIDPDVYHDLLAQDASLHIRSRRNQPCVMVSFPAGTEGYLARYVMGNPKNLHVHHAILDDARAYNLFNTRSMLQTLTAGEHAGVHRRAEAKRRRGLQNELP